MPYKYYKDFETVESLDRDYCNEGRYAYPPGTYSPGKAIRTERAHDRENYIRELEQREMCAPQYVSFSVDLKNRYQLKSVINLLTQALNQCEQEYKIIADIF